MQITLQSKNSKTGPMPVSMSPSAHCPDDCRLRHTGCYAAAGRIFMHWRRISTRWHDATPAERAELWRQHLATIRSIPLGMMWRCHQAGDFWGRRNRINKPRLLELARANMRRPAIAYSHYRPTGHNLEAFRAAAELGFHVNMSADNLEEADEFAETGLPVVVLLPTETAGRTTTTPAGRTVTICPASHRKDITCGGGLVGDRWTKRCGICANPCHAIIGFPAHGRAKRAADSVARQEPTL